MENDGTINTKAIAGEIQSRIGKDTVNQIMRSAFEDSKIKVSQDAHAAVAEVIKLLCTEGCLRAINQCLRDNGDKVDIEHLEKCLPQLMLDFP